MFFRSINNMKLRSEQGFTLVELLIVIAIIGILMAIAVPVFLGQRARAKVSSVEAGAKGAVSEIQGWLDAYVADDPILVLDANGSEVCYESALSNRKCENIYNRAGIEGMADIGELIDIMIDHYAGKQQKSPFNSVQSLFVRDDIIAGTVVLGAEGERTLSIAGYAEDLTTPVFSTNITAR